MNPTAPRYLQKVSHPGFRNRFNHRRGIYVPTRMPWSLRPSGWSKLLPRPRGMLFTIPMIWSGNPCAPITETLLPISDITQGEWSENGGTGTRASCLDNFGSDAENLEADFSGYDNTDCPSHFYITDCEVRIANPSAAPASYDCGQRLKIRMKIGDNDTGSEGCSEFRNRLQDGGTLIATHTSNDPGTTAFAVDLQLTNGQYDNITDFDDLRLRLRAGTGKTDKLPVECFITYAAILYSEV